MRRIWTLYLKRTIAILPSADWSIYHQSTHGLLHNHTCTLSRTPAHCHSHICPLMTFGQKERRRTAHLQLDLVLDSGRGWLMNRTCKLIFWCFLHSHFSLVRVVCTNCLCPPYVCARVYLCSWSWGYSDTHTRILVLQWLAFVSRLIALFRRLWLALLYCSAFPFSLSLPLRSKFPPDNFSNWLFQEFQLDTILPTDSAPEPGNWGSIFIYFNKCNNRVH